MCSLGQIPETVGMELSCASPALILSVTSLIISPVSLVCVVGGHEEVESIPYIKSGTGQELD